MRRKYLYKYIQMRHRGKKAKQKTILLLIIITMNNYDNKNDKIRWYKVKKRKSVSKILKIIAENYLWSCKLQIQSYNLRGTKCFF